MLELNKTKIGNFDFYYRNEKEFRTLYQEIFNDEVYAFQADCLDPIIIDCGSHLGLSIIYYKTKYPNSKIIAFEPDENTFKILEKNIKENNIVDVELHNTALSDKDGMTKFWYESDLNLDSCGNTTTKWWGARFGFAEKNVPTVKLSNFIKGKVDFLKIDVEGAEFYILDDIKDKLNFVKNFIIEIHLSDVTIKKSELVTIENELIKNKLQFKEEFSDIADIIPPRYKDWVRKYHPGVCIIKANKND